MTNIKGKVTLSENEDTAEILSRFYRQFMNAYEINRDSSKTQLECNEQYAVTGVMLSVISGSMCIEERKCLDPLSKDIFIEFETGGNSGWAIDLCQQLDLIVFLYRNFICAFSYDDFHEFCASYRQMLLYDVGVVVNPSKGDDVNLCAKVPIDFFLELYAASGNDFIKQAVLV